MLPLLVFVLAADPAPVAPRVVPNAVPAAAISQPADNGALVTLYAPAGTIWHLGSEAACSFWPETDGTICRLSGSDGRFLVIAQSGTATTRYCVVFGVPKPMPPGPGPAPVPVPPTPVPPQPVDPLKATLTAAFNADAGDAAQKKDDVLQLAALYTAAVDVCTDPSLKTPRELLTKIRGAGDSLTKDRLAKLREAFKVELQAVLPALDSPLTADSRAKAADLFKRAEVILEALGKPTK